MEAQAAHRTLDMLVRRYGAHRASELTGVDTESMYQTVTLQRNHILQDLTSEHPNMLPKGDLLKYSGFVRDREESREAGVVHFDTLEEQAQAG